MMHVQFLAHSGFLIELDSACLLFDWWKGNLPPLPEKPLFVFVSHGHGDHFNPAVFALDDGSRDVRFFLGKDIRLSPSRRKHLGLSAETAAKCLRLSGSQRAEPAGITVETLPSTDEGVAFLVTAEGQTIFHAGDLNWWHWEGEPDPWNPEMEKNFKAYAEPLRGRRIDLALLPLDPRLKEDGFRGAEYFLQLADIRRFIPMHLWGKFGFTQDFLTRFPQFTERTVPVTQDGQRWDF